VFECLAERTIALAQQSKLKGVSEGYDPLLEERMLAVLSICRDRNIKIISNMGAANPIAAAMRTKEIAGALNICGLRIAAITGDDVFSLIQDRDLLFEENSFDVASLAGKIVSANAYLGAAPIVEALAAGADIVLIGRVADPSLFLGPLIHEFGWAANDWRILGQGTVIGHLLECAGQITGGYFADPGYKDVPDLAHLGFPLAEVTEDGTAVITKVEGSGGAITRAVCKEQLLYEIQNPAAYPTPDVLADFSQVRFSERGRDRILVSGGSGSERPSALKVSVGYQDCYVGEGQISYAGPGALARAQLAKSIIAERIHESGYSELRFDLIGLNSILGDRLPVAQCEPREIRLRVVGRAESPKLASLIPREVEALYTNGPAGGGGVTSSIRDAVGILSTFVPREMVTAKIHFEVS
jgi:hypothetical protein